VSSRLLRQGKEISNLEGGLSDLMKEVDTLKACLDEKDETIWELQGSVDHLTNKRCRCNDDKVSPCS